MEKTYSEYIKENGIVDISFVKLGEKIYPIIKETGQLIDHCSFSSIQCSPDGLTELNYGFFIRENK